MNEQPYSEANPQQPTPEQNIQPFSEVNSQQQSADETQVRDESENNSKIDQSNSGPMGNGQQATIGDNNTQTQNIIEKIEKLEINPSMFFKHSGLLSLEDPETTQKEPFVDPTTPLPPKPRQVFEFESVDLLTYTQKLKEENLLVISCFNQDILLTSAYALAEKLDRINDKRLLSFEGKNSKRSDLCIELLCEEQIGEEQESLIVIDAVRSQSFLDSLIVYSQFTVEKIKQDLKTKKRFLICLANPEILDNNIQLKQQECLFFENWHISFLKYLLKSKFLDKSIEIEEKVIEQKKRGLWGESDREFYELIYGFIKNDRLIQEVEKRANIQENIGIEEIIQELQSIRPSNVFLDDEIIKNTVLYVATFFPNLSPNDFFRIVDLLLANKILTVTTQSKKLTKDGDAEILEIQEEKLARKIWEDSSDKILKKCCLKAVIFKESTRVIDFSEPYLRRELREYLEEYYSTFLQKQFKLIQELGLLFDASQRVTENVIQLYTSMANSYTEDYGDDWLVHIILKSTKPFNVNIESDVTSEELLVNLLEAFSSEMVFSRIAELIREMLNYPKLQEIVDSFLEQLIAWKRHDAVLAIVKRLRYAPQFDEFYWLKQLLERGNKEICSETYNFLYNQARQSGFRIYELLETIQEWLPELNRENYSKANQCALQLFIQYSSDTTSKIPIKYYGNYPPKHPLLAALFKESDKDYLDILINWLFHPGIKKLSDSHSSFISFVGTLLAEWWTIIYGLNKNSTHQEAIQKLNELIQKVVYMTPVDQQTELIDFWENLKSALLEAMDQLEQYQSPNLSEDALKLLDVEINQINRRRQVINELIKQFNKSQLEVTQQSI